MKTLSTFASLLCLSALAATFSSPAFADEWNKKTIITFSNPVEVPGVVLGAGTYVFRLVDSPSDRHIVQISNEREDHVFATILAIPNYQLEPKGKTVMTFYEGPAGAPEAIRAWFYPGDNFGQEFYYPKGRAAELTTVTHQQVPSVPAEMESKLVAPEPTPAPVAAAPEPAPAAAPAEPAPAAVAAPTTEEPPPQPAAPAAEPAPMPKTASNMPLIALLGVFSLVGAAGIRRFASRRS